MGFGGRAVETPGLWVIHLGTLLGEPMDYFGRELKRVGVTERIPLPDDAAHAGQLDTQGLEATLTAFGERLLAGGDLLADIVGVLDEEACVLPVAMGEQHNGRLACDLLGAIKVTGHEEPGRTFEVDLFNGVFAAVDFAMDDGVEGRARGHR